MTSVLLFCYNRPIHAKRMLERLKELGVKRLYISLDALGEKLDPFTGEFLPVYDTYMLDLLEKFDFKGMTVVIKKLDRHYGVCQGPIEGMKWFFTHEKEGVILDDDCMPADDFFKFMSAMLEKYRDSNKVTHIAGYNPDPESIKDEDYVLTRIPLNWGWATWKHKFFIPNEKDTPHIISGIQTLTIKQLVSKMSNLKVDKLSKIYLADKFLTVARGDLKAWDYMWFYYNLTTDKLCVIPSINLIEYIGYDMGTNTVGKGKAVPVGSFNRLHYFSPITTGDLDQQIFYKTQKSKFRLYLWHIKRLILNLIK